MGRIQYNSREVQQAENIRKMLIAMSEDIRVIIIKLADRLHNMRTARYWSPDKQREKALESMEVYAPIAHRLGIRAIKEELEDLSLRILDPYAYKEIENSLALRHEERDAFIEKTKRRFTTVFPLLFQMSIFLGVSRASTAFTARCLYRAKIWTKFMIFTRYASLLIQ
jgi:GTP pyrophosphokinase